MITMGIAFTSADAIVQNYVEECEKMDYRRSLSTFTIGILFAPLLDVWITKWSPNLAKTVLGSFGFKCTKG